MSALQTVAPLLRCPVCGDPLALHGAVVSCARGHRFDVAKQGYVSLGTGARMRHPGDTAEMVRARASFLARGHYDRIAAAVIETVPHGITGMCADLAGGTGHYLSAVLDARDGLRGLSVDSSVPAARAAARAHARAASVAADIRDRLPVATGAAAHALVVFGPRNGFEIARILAPGAAVTVVTPRPEHLDELRSFFPIIGIGTNKEERLDASLAPLSLIDRRDVHFRADLRRADIVDLVIMGPNGHHQSRADVEAVAAEMPDELGVAVAVTVSRYTAPVGV